MKNFKSITNEELQNITFGVEIETILPMTHNVAVGGYHRGTPVPQSPAFAGRNWKAERDGSLYSTNGVGVEFVSPILKGEEGIQNVMDMLDWLRSIGAKINNRCGVHIHIGVSSVIGHVGVDETMKYIAKAVRSAKRFQNGIFAQTGTARQANSYCLPLSDHDKNLVDRSETSTDCYTKQAHLTQIGRYRMLNVSCFANKGTLEFRAFAGTLNKFKMLNHILTAIGVTFHAKTESKKTIWKDSNMDGLQSYRLLFRQAICPVLRATRTFRGRKMKVRAWGIGMAAQWDRVMGRQMTAKHTEFLTAIGRL